MQAQSTVKTLRGLSPHANSALLRWQVHGELHLNHRSPRSVPRAAAHTPLPSLHLRFNGRRRLQNPDHWDRRRPRRPENAPSVRLPTPGDAVARRQDGQAADLGHSRLAPAQISVGGGPRATTNPLDIPTVQGKSAFERSPLPTTAVRTECGTCKRTNRPRDASSPY